jgi:hypothetical protein
VTLNNSDSIAVFYLLRKGTPPSSVEKFLNSYRMYPTGIPHRLVVLYKGFDGVVPDDIESLVSDLPHERLFCPDIGFDIGTYFFAAETFNDSILMFLNSHSLVNRYGWLNILLEGLYKPDVRLIGCTGSWESKSSRFLDDSHASFLNGTARYFYSMRKFFIGLGLIFFFPLFPNPHIRTNAFMIRRRDFLNSKPLLPIRTKFQAWMFESGRWSLTRGLESKKFKFLVTGRNGKSYSLSEWNTSDTFWQGNQINTLIHDNQTLKYLGVKGFQRKKLSLLAWGKI